MFAVEDRDLLRKPSQNIDIRKDTLLWQSRLRLSEVMVIIMPSELTVSITGVEQKRGGAEVELRVAIASGERREERVLRVAAEMLFEIGNITGDQIGRAHV